MITLTFRTMTQSCQRSGNTTAVLILIAVHSLASDPEPRHQIRQTWGSIRRHEQYRVKTVFMLGKAAAQDAVAEESRKYGDIVQEDFVEHYRNLTLKHVMVLKWVQTFCPDARFVIKVDDDVFINMFQLFKFFRSQHHQAEHVSRLLYCSVYRNMPTEKGR